MKKNRLAKILELINEFDIETQEEMQTYLLDCGIDVTQATVSRDIKELKLVKATTESGKSKYILPQQNNEKQHMFNSIFTSSVISVDYALNTVVIKCGVGMAMAACASFDSMGFSDILGTIAGDDTIFAIMRSEASAAELYKSLQTQLLK